MELQRKVHRRGLKNTACYVAESFRESFLLFVCIDPSRKSLFFMLLIFAICVKSGRASLLNNNDDDNSRKIHSAQLPINEEA